MFWPYIILVGRKWNDLSSTGCTSAYIPVIEQFDDCRGIKAFQPGNVLPAAEQVTA